MKKPEWDAEVSKSLDGTVRNAKEGTRFFPDRTPVGGVNVNGGFYKVKNSRAQYEHENDTDDVIPEYSTGMEEMNSRA
jgi:hypothetical protein